MSVKGCLKPPKHRLYELLGVDCPCCEDYMDYNCILRSFDWEVVLEKSDNDYQGDTRILFKDGNRYGYLIFGWGSCSGCDALQACYTIEEVRELQERLKNDVIWQDNAQEALIWFKNRDWETKQEWHAEGTKEFVKEAIELLERAIQ